MNFLRRGFRKPSSDRRTYIQTDRTEIIYHTASRVVKNFVFEKSKGKLMKSHYLRDKGNHGRLSFDYPGALTLRDLYKRESENSC